MSYEEIAQTLALNPLSIGTLLKSAADVPKEYITPDRFYRLWTAGLSQERAAEIANSID